MMKWLFAGPLAMALALSPATAATLGTPIFSQDVTTGQVGLRYGKNAFAPIGTLDPTSHAFTFTGVGSNLTGITAAQVGALGLSGGTVSGPSQFTTNTGGASYSTQNIIANGSFGNIPQIGPRTQGALATYQDRDSVGQYLAMRVPPIMISAQGTFTATTFTPTTPFSTAQLAKMQVGQVVDTNDVPPLSAYITSFNANVINFSGGWTQNGHYVSAGGVGVHATDGSYVSGNQATGQVPAGNTAYINSITKGYGINWLIEDQPDSYVHHGTNGELDVANYNQDYGRDAWFGAQANGSTVLKSDSYVGGLDLADIGTYPGQWGFQVRGTYRPFVAYSGRFCNFCSRQMNGGPLTPYPFLDDTGSVQAFSQINPATGTPIMIMGMGNATFGDSSQASQNARTITFITALGATESSKIYAFGGTSANDSGGLGMYASLFQVTAPSISLIGSVSVTGTTRVVPVAFASLPACTSSIDGTSATITDGGTPTYNGAAVGGGSAHVPVYCNGTSWTYH